MHTLCGTVLRTSSHRIRNYADSNGETGTGGNFRISTAGTRQISTSHVINTATETTFTISGGRGSCNIPNGRFKLQFRLRPASPTGRRHHNNSAGHVHHLLIFHVRPANPDHNNGQIMITGMGISH